MRQRLIARGLPPGAVDDPAGRLKSYGTDGLGKLGKRAKAQRKEMIALRTKLVGGRNPKRPIFDVEDIDPSAFRMNPCTGQLYRNFRMDISPHQFHVGMRREGKTVGKKHWRKEMGDYKRALWQQELLVCAQRVFLSRAKVSKDPKVRKYARDLLAAGGDLDHDPYATQPLDDDEPFTLFGLPKKGKTKGRKKTPKKRKARR